MGYLLISRGVDDKLIINDNIEIMISNIDIKNKKVDLAIKAPLNIKIIRKELLNGEIDNDSNRD